VIGIEGKTTVVDLGSIGVALSSIKTAGEIAKMLKDSDLSLEQAEFKFKLAELVSSLADAKMEIAAVQESIVEKDRIIRDLKNANETHKKMVWQGSVYYQESEGEVDEVFCPQCYDNHQKAIRLQNHGSMGWYCKTCSNGFDKGK